MDSQNGEELVLLAKTKVEIRFLIYNSLGKKSLEQLIDDSLTHSYKPNTPVLATVNSSLRKY